MGKSVISQDYMEQVLSVRPESLLFARYAYNLLAEKKLQQALEVVEKGIDEAPNFATGRFVFALCLIAQKEYDAAINQLQFLLRIEPAYIAALDKFAEILDIQGDTEKSHTIEDFIARQNPNSRFLGRNPYRNNGNDTVYEISGGQINWKDFASQSYLDDKEETERQESSENKQELSLEDQIQNEMIDQKANEIVADVEANTHTLSLEDTGKQIDDIYAQIEKEGFQDEQDPAETVEIKPDFSNVSPKANSETLSQQPVEASEELNRKADEIVADVEANTHTLSLEDTGKQIDDIYAQIEKEGFQEEPIELSEPKEISFEEQLENELSEAITQENISEDIDNDIVAELEMQENSTVPENAIVEEVKADDEKESENISIIDDAFADDFAASIIAEESELQPQPKSETSETQNEFADFKNMIEEQPIAAQTFDNSFENYLQETKKNAPTVLENVDKLNIEEQVAEPIKEDEAFADMIEKNGTGFLPEHILTPTFAQIYLEQNQPFLAKQIYERLLEREGENDEYSEKLEEINNTIEKMSDSENEVLDEPEEIDFETLKTTPLKAESPKKPLQGKRIKKEVREVFKEKHSAHSKESADDNDAKIL